MPGLIGYMLAIVVTLGGYFAGLNWLISPPDPWQPNPRISLTTANQAKKRPPPVKRPAEASAAELTEGAKEDIKVASAETAAPVQASEIETIRPIEQNITEAARPVAASARIVRREAPPTKIKSGNRKRVERNTSRKLELMVLRTYERSDGKRFTRLLSMDSARNALAFQPDNAW
jgi:hypothetical protein